MIKHLFIVLSFIISINLSALVDLGCSANLDAPGGKKVTVRTEIKRGCSAVFQAFLKSHVSDISSLLNNIDKGVFARNEQENTDTAGFVVGAYYYAFLDTFLLLKTIDKHPRDPAEREFLRGSIEFYHNQYRKLARKIRLSDQNVADACERDYGSAQSFFKEWERTQGKLAQAPKQEEHTIKPPEAKKTEDKTIEVQQVELLNNSRNAALSPANSANVAKLGYIPTKDQLQEMVNKGQASLCVVQTTPAGAEIIIDDKQLGISPIAFYLIKYDSPRVVKLVMPGYKTLKKEITPDGKFLPFSFILEKDN